MQGHWISVVLPLLFFLIAAYTLFDEALVRWLHRRGVAATARVVAIVRSFPKTGLRLFALPGKRDSLDTATVPCDYVLTLAVRLPDGSERTVRNVIVPAYSKTVGSHSYACYHVGDELPVRCHPRWEKQVVVATDEVAARQTRLLPLLAWALCAALAGALVVGMLIVFG